MHQCLAGASQPCYAATGVSAKGAVPWRPACRLPYHVLTMPMPRRPMPSCVLLSLRALPFVHLTPRAVWRAGGSGTLPLYSTGICSPPVWFLLVHTLCAALSRLPLRARSYAPPAYLYHRCDL